MAKELVISANRHETKVAVLEDDQLVEVFFQRANEYSLAGSIHKGRVTRVLPGMQSAFVDLGLERDTFLYVSDFLEDHADEYERITPADDRRQRQPRTEAAPPPSPPAPAAPPAPQAPPSERTERAERPMTGERAGTSERTDRGERPDRTGDDRGGRRSRRRRNRGRGFPESKYASDVTIPATLEETEESPTVAEDFMVLPGESLAKYTRPSGEAETDSGNDSDDRSGTAVADEVAGVSDGYDTATEEVPERAQDEEGSAAGQAPEVAEDVEAEPVAEPAVEEPPVDDTGTGSTLDITGEDAEPSADLVEELEGARGPEEELDASTDEVPTVLDETGDSTDTVVSASDEFEDNELREMILEAQAAADERASLVEDDAAEAVEDQTRENGESLTAGVRDREPRYMHRVSRRMRGRRGQRGPQGPQIAPEIEAARLEAPVSQRQSARAEKPVPSISDLLREGQEIIVQIAKEPLGQKGARITSHVALPGRYVVYMPTLEHMGVSRKIASDEERQRLKRILMSQRSGLSGGYICRTAAEGRSEEQIGADMRFLANLWQDIKQKAEKKPAPVLLHHDLDIVQRILRDQVADSFKAIWTDNEEVYESVLRFVQRFQPALVGKIKLYTRIAPVFDAFNITAELEKALRPKVWLKSGGYIVINQTEALVAIDVNTGKFVGKSNRLEDTIVKTNTEAVREIVRQIRLRDLGGIIVVDFIDMDERKNRQKVMQALEEAMRADRAPNKILQFNDFGLVAITRKRVKQSLERTLCAPCLYCEGAGYVKSVQTVIGEILQEANKIAKAVEGSDVMLRVHPEVAKVLKSTENKYLEELEEILGRPVMVVGDSNLHQEKFDLA
jgi:ribonuclease G